MATKFTILTENKKLDKVIEQIAEHFENFTLTLGAIGYWKGKAEASLTIELIWFSGLFYDQLNLREYRATVKVLALQLKALLEQETVLITEEEITAEFV